MDDAIFEKMIGYHYVPTKHHKGDFTLEDSVEEMMEESKIMKMMYKAAEFFIRKGMGKNSEEVEADVRMAMASSMGSSMRAMIITSGMKGGALPGLVDMANGHFFHGLGRMIGIVKK